MTSSRSGRYLNTTVGMSPVSVTRGSRSTVLFTMIGTVLLVLLLEMVAGCIVWHVVSQPPQSASSDTTSRG
jgi:hypothetical protein